MRNVKIQIKNILRMAVQANPEEESVRLFREAFEKAYPRMNDRPDQKMLCEQLFRLYRDAECVIRPSFEAIRESDPRQFGVFYKMYLNTVHEIGSILVKMGLTFCSQAYQSKEEMNTADPKAVQAVQKNIDRLRANIEEAKKKLPMPPSESEPLEASNSTNEEGED